MKTGSKHAAAALSAAVVLAVAGTSVVGPATSATTASAPRGASTAPAPAAAPAFLRAATARDLPTTGADAVEGTRRLVTLDTSLLPQQGRGQALGLAVDSTGSVTVRVEQVVHEAAFTSWTGSVVGEMGSFTLVEADGVYRGQVTTADGIHSLSSAGGDRYWLTDVAPFPNPTVDDAITHSDHDAVGASAGPSAAPTALESRAGKKGKGKKGKKGRGGKAKITVLFGYTKDALLVAGGKPQLKAAAAQVVADTNLSMANSGVRAKIKYRGLVKGKGKEKASQFSDYDKLYRPGDGKYDNLLRARNRKGADLVHMFLGGRDQSLCGLGALPVSKRRTNPAYSVSVSALGCVPNLTPTHEIGHNLGADHISYPGVTHYSKMNFAHGYADPAHGFITVMSYYDPCFDIGINCQKIPYYSSKKALINGLPTGSKTQNNAKAVNIIAPAVARYRR